MLITGVCYVVLAEIELLVSILNNSVLEDKSVIIGNNSVS